MKQKKNLTEKERFKLILDQVSKNPEKGLKEFYKTYGTFVYDVALSFCADEHLAQDILDEVVEKIWIKSSTIDDINNPKGWLRTVTTNLTIDHLRIDVYLLPPIDIPTDGGISEYIENDSFISKIKHLSPDERVIVALRLHNNNTFQEIADAFGMPQSSVSSTFYRALDKVRQKLEKK